MKPLIVKSWIMGFITDSLTIVKKESKFYVIKKKKQRVGRRKATLRSCP